MIDSEFGQLPSDMILYSITEIVLVDASFSSICMFSFPIWRSSLPHNAPIILLRTPLMWHFLSTQVWRARLMYSAPPRHTRHAPQLARVHPSHSPHRRAFVDLLPLPYAYLQGPNSMEKLWLEFWLEKPLEFWLEIPRGADSIGIGEIHRVRWKSQWISQWIFYRGGNKGLYVVARNFFLLLLNCLAWLCLGPA